AAAAVLSLATLPAGRTTHVGRPARLHPAGDGTSTVELLDAS
ncbi:MAG: hypothetical protein JWN08_665, partial [Frankiales bacterium]|nr:hypothetical protein [Frankiales bacterium]